MSYGICLGCKGPSKYAQTYEIHARVWAHNRETPEDAYHPMTDVIHKVLNDITVDDWSIIIGGDSHTRMSKGVAFGADSGTVALALATGQATMPIPETVKVTFKEKWANIWIFVMWSMLPRHKCWNNLVITCSKEE